MSCQNSLNVTKIKAILLTLIGTTIIVSGSAANNVMYCIQAPCPQNTSTIIGQIIYRILTFNELFINTQFAVGIKNLLQPIFSAGTTYLMFSFFISIVVWHLIISLLLCFYSRFSKNNKTD
ncbi:MAG: hypothetical protein COZ34_00665 [Candidatus Pacebacteria bacterium CG_4_10_14_3_um_filter_34_15]|nr:hypothetical protein [Candidatus Paceibacterota bacterium]OIO45263.1 MAG: hypothetical protein AUJ41_00360 [Candidatus Pacebacteria bacterium CG1_02_43_31]PIQ80662.1 MAG: hypothetical protein COV78_04400 [Candidatus Pacebacteria bacterium CG11_big_fil_rev_8_21_14_0_20_34_55]PIX81941.1 MAG: hypothetical protein COZ34_00665 [Candidatus Pacebacteria bacterium CG_4_10_14_3_um_filter_34_15]PJC43700.1 MAG: hypothetical protein CO039_02700 [Candidatus Pacebacteria bacterium CG_4_9_14_0_2_um_filter_